ncbi:phage antirepressor protein [Pseudomonas juntendi]|uniref:phage antirepressor protein n=1 Tax=Pseudomonas juntendi TaxID=2666183 RepID=UPI0018D6DB60|nr:phage antirepressor protein [Pseudomonas juntendi]MBH3383813.1 phage antirepressor protein [Pseudomonas juntendi]
MNAVATTITEDTVTMTSLELVELINATREPGQGELRHDNFMAKVPKVLGICAPKFLGTQSYGNNNTRPIYRLPKREACLVAMSYSYELQARVYDRMVELEAAIQKPALPNFMDPAEAAIAWAGEYKQRQALALENQTLTQANAEMFPHATVGSLVGARKALTVVDFARKLPGVNTQQVQNTLERLGYLFKREGKWAVYADYKERLFDEKVTPAGFSAIVALEKGQKLIAKLYLAHELVMKSGRKPQPLDFTL